jgi:hypothetical protein
MEGSNHEVQEIVPSVLNRTRCKKYRQKILLEPLNPYAYRHSNISLMLKMVVHLLQQKILASDKLFLLFCIQPSS